jgi:ribosomal protein S18 acetylase RimI-like enzyme
VPGQSIHLVDLDQRPDQAPTALALFAACPPGAEHQVCGIAAWMGLVPTQATLDLAAGVLLAMAGNRALAALAICPYSEEQVTIWGPAASHAAPAAVSGDLLDAARGALQLSRYGSMRTLVDIRNRKARALLQSHGFNAWKDNLLFERRFDAAPAEQPTRVRLATARDHSAVATVFIQGFPDSDHCLPNLAKREHEGFRHYLLEDAGQVVAAAAVQDAGGRAWLKLITTRPDLRGKGHSRMLLEGVLVEESKRHTRAIALEVLVDNHAAVRLYEGSGFKRRFTATVMTGPV